MKTRAVLAVVLLAATAATCSPTAPPPATTSTSAKPTTTTVAPPPTTTTVAPSGAALTAVMLKAAVTDPRPVFPFTSDPNQWTPRYSFTTAGPQTWRLPPGTVEVRNGDGQYANGYGPWIELTATSRTNTGAKVSILAGHLYSLSKSTGRWTERVAWGGPLNAAGHLWVWQGEVAGQATTDGTPTYGWGSCRSTTCFGDHHPDDQAPNGDGFVRIHGWPMSWIGVNGFFWTSTDPAVDNASPSVSKLDDLAGIVAVVVAQAVGTTSSTPQFAMTTGWDTMWSDLATTGLPPGARTGSGGGTYLIGSQPALVVCSTLSPAQVDAHPLTMFPGWS